MNHIGLFEGIGGFSYAAKEMKWETIAWCEWNPFCQQVLGYHFPKAKQHGDITKTDFTIYREQCDILTGGFPCQPYSLAGKRKGKDDERHLWPEMLRAIREIQPRWVVGENVFGLVNWNGGLVFHEVQADLEAEGYEVQPFILPACAVNAPHRRDRVWFVAYRNTQQRKRKERGFQSEPFDGSKQNATNPNSNEQQRCNSEHEINASEGREYAQCNTKQSAMHGISSNTNCTSTKHTVSVRRDLPTSSFQHSITNTSSSRRENGLHGGSENGKRQTGELGNPNKEQFTQWQDFPTQSPLCSGDDGLSTELDGITFSKWRNESIKAYGNAIVPQVALQIFKAIEQYEKTYQ